MLATGAEVNNAASKDYTTNYQAVQASQKAKMDFQIAEAELEEALAEQTKQGAGQTVKNASKA